MLTLSRRGAHRIWRWAAVVSAGFGVTTLGMAFRDRFPQTEVTVLAVRQFSLAAEGSLAVYWSSLLLSLTAAAAAACWMTAPARGSRGFERHGWLAIAAGLLALSLDESASLHERVALTGLPDMTFGMAVGWIAILAPVFLVAAAGMIVFALRLLRDPVVMLLLIVGAVLYSSVLLLELLEVRAWGADFSNRSRWIGAATLEEVVELGGTLAVLGATLRFLTGPGAWRPDGAPSTVIALSPSAAGRIAVAGLSAATVVALWHLAFSPAALDHPFHFMGPLPWFSGFALLLTAAGGLLRSQRLLAAVALLWALDQGAGLALTEQLWAGSPRAALAARLAIAAATLAAGLTAARSPRADGMGRRVALWSAGMACAALLPTGVQTAALVVLVQWLLAPSLLRQPVAVALTGRRERPRSGSTSGLRSAPAYRR